MKNTKLYFSSLPFILLFIFSCTSKIEKSLDFTTVDRMMEQAVADSVFPGAALLFGTDKQILYSKGFGHFTYDKNSLETKTNSIFDLASVSKVVGTTSAAMILVQEGKLNLDQKVITYLPAFNNNGKENITIRNLLLHNSGLAPFKKYYDEFTNADEVINDIMNLPLNNPPGEKFVYSDLGMITLQKVIEEISGKSLDVFLQEKLFSKLEMNQTMYNPSNDVKKFCVPTELDDFWRMRLLQGEVHDERAYMLNGVAGHAGLFSTVEDLSKFVMMLMNKGEYKGQQIINPKIIDEWTTRQSEESDRGIGWDTKAINGYSSAGHYLSKDSFGHTGYTGTSIWVDKENKLFVIFLSNRVHPTRANTKISEFRPIIHDAIFEAVFGKK
ncbi:MAG: serine hydrolase [Ignavibacteriae bacterium]|nr:serine hydrolase [Ignavibacteriota bacterium]